MLGPALPLRRGGINFAVRMIVRQPVALSRLAGALVALGGTVVLTGWFTGTEILTSFVPGWLAMKVNTAIGFVLTGLALALLAPAETLPLQFRTGRLCAGFAAILGLLTLLQYPLNRDFGIDQLLIPEAPGAVETVHLGRMAPATALAFVLAGTGLLLPRRRFPRTFQVLVHLTGLLAVISACHYAYLGRPLLPYTQMAFHSAVLFLVLAGGILATRADSGPVAVLAGDSAGGRAARRLLPAATLVPLTLGWLLIRGESSGWYDFATGTLLYAVSTVGIVGGLVWIHALRLHRADHSRRSADAKVMAQLGRLHLLEQVTRAIGERHDLPSIYQVVVRRLEENLPLGFCAILIHDEAGGPLHVAHVGLHEPALGAALARLGGSRLAAVEHGRLLYEPDLTKAGDLPLLEELGRAGLRALVLAPLTVEGNVFGLLLAARRAPSSFSSSECEFLSQTAAHTALATHQHRLRGKLQHAYDELRATQQAVLQQERLNALGQLASGIAHDINNAITPATLYAEFVLQTESALSPKSREHLQNIKATMTNVSQTVARLRDFSRGPEPDAVFAPVDLAALIAEVVRLTRARWSDIPQQSGVLIELTQDLAVGVPAIDGVEAEVRDSLTNLIFNAVDAMPSGGRLTLRTRLLPAGRRNFPPPRLALEVSDTGTGMNEETRHRCLEPFFTTKGRGGTGLGLAMVYGMVQRHNATLEIDSEPGQGTTFRICFGLPAVPTPQSASRVVGSQPVRPLRLLVVDDDPLILRSLRDVLTGDGHSVVACPGGLEGLAAFTSAQARGDRFDAVITDLGMPQVDGRTVAAAIKSAGNIPVILLTGWGQQKEEQAELPRHVDVVLPKPPQLPDLRAALAQLCA